MINQGLPPLRRVDDDNARDPTRALRRSTHANRRALCVARTRGGAAGGGGGGRRRPVDGENGITEDGVLESIVVWYVP